ncbi:hypothetical protein [Asticcacaulis biprosthecium]|uniref:hypothetical protein n=1 Tax=Asticcacaulis biprosthecium TaxID=76891 RepID=UPI00058E361B|nr:hypothetical protein [Asticcacaulis biprosthecium]
MIDTLAKDFGYKDFVEVIYALVNGESFDTGPRRFAEYVQARCVANQDAGWKYSLSRSIISALDHISVKVLIANELSEERRYGRDEFLVLCRIVKSPDLARVLYRLYLQANENSVGREFSVVFGTTLVDAVKNSISSVYSIEIAQKLCKDPLFTKFGAILYFCLLYQAQIESHVALPNFISRFQVVTGGIEQKFLRKQVEAAFKEIDLNFYLNRLPHQHLHDFLKIIYKTDIAQAYNSINIDAEIQNEADRDLPASQGYFQTSSNVPIEKLHSETSRAWTAVRTHFVASNPTAVSANLKALAEALH